MDPIRKIGNLTRSFTPQDREDMAKAQRRILNGYPALTRWNIARVLATGAVLLVGAALYLNMVSEVVADAPMSEQNTEARPANNVGAYIGRQIDDDEWIFGPPYIEEYRPDEAASPGNHAWAKRSQEEKGTLQLLRLEARTSEQAAFLLDEVNDGAMTGAQAWKQVVRVTSGRVTPDKFLNQGPGGYSVKEQMEILEEAKVPGLPNPLEPV